MIDLKRGGWTGNLGRIVRRDFRELHKTNATARAERYSPLHRSLRWLLSLRAFAKFLVVYGIVLGALLLFEGWVSAYIYISLKRIPPLASSTELFKLTQYASGYFLTAQVGALAVITVALALVTLLAQGARSASDIALYYHHSLARELAASSMALLTVLSAQLVWPLFTLGQLHGFGTELPTVIFALLCIHGAWLLVNLCGTAHFIATTLGIVEQDSRERMRRQLTVNVLQPKELKSDLRRAVYTQAVYQFIEADPTKSGEPDAHAGFGGPSSYDECIEYNFDRAHCLVDVRLSLVRYVLRQWAQRCRDAAQEDDGSFPHSSDPRVYFAPTTDQPLTGRTAWCRRVGGEPFTKRERWLLKRAFRFRRVADEI